MDLLERKTDLAVLEEAVAQAATGAGKIVLVAGEAGIGKSTLLERAFRLDGPFNGRLLWGACDSLFTPRPLGPLHDVATQAGGRLLAAATSSAGREALFGALLEELRRAPTPAVLVVEDAHWADDATLDLLKFLGRRIDRVPAVLVVSFRDDEVGASHPLRLVIGDLPAANVRRLRMKPLSQDAVAKLARAAQRDAATLFAVTGGNPFFVTEALASEGDEIPVTVRDAVVARAARISPAARGVMELASVVPGRIERWLVDTLLAPSADAIDECRSIGMVQGRDSALAFRHELARRAIEDALSPDRRRSLHAACLAALVARGADTVPAARLVHHADHAGDIVALLHHGPIAAARAAAVGAHRDAASLYDRVLECAEALPSEQHAELLERHAYECYLTDRIEDALTSRRAALVHWRAIGSRLREGDTLRWMSRLSWFLGARDDADRFGVAAVETLEGIEPGHELAMALSNRAQLAMLIDDSAGAESWGRRALAIADTIGDAECQAHALNNVGSALYDERPQESAAMLERSLGIALEHGLQEHVARAYTNLVSCTVKRREYQRAREFLRAGLAYCEERDLDSWTLYKLAWRGQLGFETGEWEQAARDASTVLGNARCAPISRIPALVVLGRVRMHRDDPGWQALLDEAHALATRTAELQRVGPVACARAESAWLHGDSARAGLEAAVAWAMVPEGEMVWPAPELVLWQHRAGRVPAHMPSLPNAVQLQLAGDWRAAADEWQRLGCPYECALALAEASEEDALRESLAILESLGSATGAAYVRRRLRESGVRAVPRGSRPSTRRNPAQLTARQLEILALVVAGRRDAEIASQLFLSTKTVGHHVSAILAKLGVRSRVEAAAAARAMGIG